MQRSFRTWLCSLSPAALAGVLAASLAGSEARAQMTVATGPFTHGFAPVAFVSPSNFADSVLDAAKKAMQIKEFCAQLQAYYKHYKWPDEPCGKVKWKADLKTHDGHPLIYAEFGNGTETTLLLGGVHGDELTPMHLAFRMARYLDEHPDFVEEGTHVVLAPLVDPDGFMRNRPTRTNGNGIDLNRNFFTMDWYDKAQKVWALRRNRQLQHFPGYFPNSEIETIFQIALIDRYRPDKILSVHAPLGFLDYDGPGSGILKPLTQTEGRAKRLVKAISESTRNYKVVDYEFYPGSLGNYAGNERRIPTVTLELQTTEPAKVDAYWKQFEPGLMQAIHYKYTRSPALEAKGGGDASQFSTLYGDKPG